MINGILGIKIEQTQAFDDKGKRIPITIVKSGPCPVVQVKTVEKDGYDSVQLGIGIRKNTKKPQEGHIKKAKIEKSPRFLEEVRLTEKTDKKIGDLITASEVFKEGDNINVTGISKGKGFAGGVKRYHFKGGPKTHGQSDRERAPGSIGSTTTPGRVYKGKRMAGKMGGEQATVKNLKIFKIDNEKNLILIKGLVPGARNSLLKIMKEN